MSLQDRPERIQLQQEDEERVVALARQISRQSSQFAASHTIGHEAHTALPSLNSSNSDGHLKEDIKLVNPFLGSDDPRLIPDSGKFDHKLWLKTLLQLESKDPERFPRRTAGVSFRDLSVHGFGTATDFQKNFGNAPLVVGGWVRKMFGLEKKRKIQILKEFDGLVKSGEMLVVLGRPGSGCSTLLKSIAGETHGFYIEEQSKLNYQGIPASLMHKNFRGDVIYQAETEAHFPQLTVGETLTFAARARAPRNRMEGVTREQYADHMRDVVMTIFGLSHTINTRVGNDFVRGVSGGERKRVSIAEVTLSGSPVQCWDNSTRGLDSATALEFVRTLRTGAECSGYTPIVAIYQASQSAYDMFDKVTVLYEGRQIYFGRCDKAKQFFLNMGYDCPLRQTTADFLTSLTSPTERIVRPGWENRVPRTAEEFAAAWKASTEYKELIREIEEYDALYPVGGDQLEVYKRSRKAQQAKHMSPMSPYTLSYPMQVKLCMTRGFQRLRNDTALLLTMILGNGIMSIVISSVFFNLKPDTASFFSRGALLFWAILVNAFASALEILTLYAQRPIIEKHDKYALYRPSAEAISGMLVDLPGKIASALISNIIIYFMPHLRREPGPFFVFLLFSFTTTLVMSNIFRTIGACSRTLSQAMPPAAIFILALITYTGFTIPIRDMVPWFRWINYLNPIAYGFEVLMVNEFDGRDFPCSQYVPGNVPGLTSGYATTATASNICTVPGAVPGQDFVRGTQYLAEAYSYSRSHVWRNFGILIGFWCFFLFTYLFAVEYIQAAKSKGEVLIFRRGYEPKIKMGEDEEAEARAKAEIAAQIDVRNEKVANIQQQTDIFMWRDVCYDIKIKSEDRRLLDNVDGWVKPGTLTALMGVSGAGKTTLLDVLASRVTMGVVSGDMLVNGHQRDASFQRKTGYVQQQDLHLDTSTVREALIFSAMLRQPAEVSREEKLAYVEEVIKLLEMEDYAEAVVGVPGEGLNVEQRKRLTIGVELAAKPQLLLFLDEPTSGLDSQTAWSICTFLRKLANNGQAILCTIHQPSAILFQEFDRLLFLAAGGRTVYFGEIGRDSAILTDYFVRNGSDPCPPDANPAEWMLEVIGAAPGAVAKKDWHEVWTNSPERQRVRHEIARMQADLSARTPAQTEANPRPFAAGFLTQYALVFKRVWEQYWRAPSYTYSKIILSTLTALFIGFSFYKADNTQQGLQNQMFAVFMLLTVFGNLVQQILPYFVTQRALYEVRERQSKTFSWQAFMAANITVEIPWQTLMAIMAYFSFYYPIGLQHNATFTDSVYERGALFFLFILSFYWFTSTFAHFIIAGVEMAETGGNLANLLFTFCLVFCGVLATPDTLPRFWIFMYRVSPFTYLVSGVLSTGLAHAPVTCSDIETRKFDPPAGMTCGQYIENYKAGMGGTVFNPNATSDCAYCQVDSTDVFLGYIHANYDDRWRDFGLMVVYVAFNVAAALFMYWLVRVPKGKRTKETVATPSQEVTPSSSKAPSLRGEKVGEKTSEDTDSTKHAHIPSFPAANVAAPASTALTAYGSGSAA